MVKPLEAPVLRGIWIVEEVVELLEDNEVLDCVKEALVYEKVAPVERRTEAWQAGARSVSSERRDAMFKTQHAVRKNEMTRFRR